MAYNSTFAALTADSKPLGSVELVVLSAVTVVTLLVGVIFNGLVVAIFLTDKRILGKTANIMIFSITISDFLQSIVAAPMLLLALNTGEWALGMQWCRVYGLLMTWFGLVSITHLSALAVERYYGLKHAVIRDLHHKGTRLGKQAVFLLWFYSLFWSIVPLMGWSDFQLEPSGVSCSVKWYSSETLDLSYNLCLIVFCFIVPVTTIMVFYILMLKTIKSISTHAIQSWGRMALSTKTTIKRERAMIWLVIAMIAAFFLAWTPYVCASVAAMLGYTYAHSSLVTTIASFTAKTSTLYNPILYVYMYRDFKLAILRYVKVRRGSDLSNSSTKRFSGYPRSSRRFSLLRRDRNMNV